MLRRNAKNSQPARRKSLHIRVGDDVIVLSGSGSRDENGKRVKTVRKVLSVLPQEGKVVVEGVNMMKDRQKNRGGSQRQSGINEQDVVEKAFPIDRSKVALVDPKDKKPTRVKMKVGADGKRVRVAGKSGETI